VGAVAKCLADWLLAQQVESVAMERTSVASALRLYDAFEHEIRQALILCNRFGSPMVSTWQPLP
jgi:hypothetical protein